MWRSASAPGEHEQGEGDLSADQDRVDAAAFYVAGGLAGIRLHHLADFRARELEGGP